MISPLYGQLSPLRVPTRLADFSPAAITGLQLWLDATTGLYDATTGGSPVTTDGSAVARWEDQSGKGFHVLQSTVNSQPTLQTAELNSKNVIRFDGLNDSLLNTTTAPFSGTTARTFFLVAKATSTGLVGMYGMGADVQMPATATNFDVTPEIRARVSGRQDFNLSMGTTDFRLLTIRFPSGGKISDISGWLDGTAMIGTPTTVASINTNSTVGFIIGRAAQLNVTHCGGDYCEFIGYNRVLNDTERQSVESYLTQKWGL